MGSGIDIPGGINKSSVTPDEINNIFIFHYLLGLHSQITYFTAHTNGVFVFVLTDDSENVCHLFWLRCGLRGPHFGDTIQ